MNIKNEKIAVIGLGYVGLPLAVEFGKYRDVVGFDINTVRICELREGKDETLEVSAAELAAATGLSYSADPQSLEDCGIFIVTVPTPVDRANRPDMTPLIRASRTVGNAMQSGAIVIYESTVYPGATEEVCVPILEEASGGKYNKDFFCGYSPERINPGDKERRLVNIKKITSGSTPEVAAVVDELYNEIILAGTYKADSIKVAEAAKVIENTQRDLNIALMNELALVLHRLDIDTTQVIRAASTKWNFLPFRPGLVGGHCIGVDPYYLAHKAQEVGYHPEVILAGRRVNNAIVSHVTDQVIKLMLQKNLPITEQGVLILGFAFKENCPDVRNTKVIDLVRSLQTYNINVDVYDPWIDVNEARVEYGITCLNELPTSKNYSAIVLAVAHREFVEMGAKQIRSFGTDNAVLYDVKSIFELHEVDARL